MFQVKLRYLFPPFSSLPPPHSRAPSSERNRSEAEGIPAAGVLFAAPTFVFQWLFDEAQMSVDNVAAPYSKAQWNYIHSVGTRLRNTLTNVT